MVTFASSITAWIGPFLDCMCGCFGCLSKPTPTAVDKPSNGLRIQERLVKKPSVSDDFWSTSTHDLETAIISQRSMSSISTSNQTLNSCCTTSGLTSHSDFTNQGKLHVPYGTPVIIRAGVLLDLVITDILHTAGLLEWNQTRLDWLGSSRPANLVKKTWEPRLNWNATYDSLLATRNPFPRPIPLSEMVDFLVDVWEHEGLYD